MLVLTRKVGQRFQIGEAIWLTVVRIGPNAVRLGIEAPAEMQIVREELVAEPDSGRSVSHGDGEVKAA